MRLRCHTYTGDQAFREPQITAKQQTKSIKIDYPQDDTMQLHLFKLHIAQPSTTLLHNTTNASIRGHMRNLRRLTGGVPYIVVLFRKAFVDPGHKIILQNTVLKIYDRKTQIVRTSARAAVGLTRLITLCFCAGWFWPAFGMTYLLAVKRAVYSPAKYGYIKELLGKQHLAAAHDVVRAVSWHWPATWVLQASIPCSI
jgi:hypothetical protein